VVEQLPALIDRIQRSSKQRRQIIISSHSEALLNNKGIDAVVLSFYNQTRKERHYGLLVRKREKDLRPFFCCRSCTAPDSPKKGRSAGTDEVIRMSGIYVATEDPLSEPWWIVSFKMKIKECKSRFVWVRKEAVIFERNCVLL